MILVSLAARLATRSQSALQSRLRGVTGSLRDVAHELTDPYRPELHYMRGPGPKWHEKHAGR